MEARLRGLVVTNICIQEADSKQELGLAIKPQDLPSDGLPIASLDLLKVPQPSQTVQLSSYQVFKHTSMGTFHIEPQQILYMKN